MTFNAKKMMKILNICLSENKNMSMDGLVVTFMEEKLPGDIGGEGGSRGGIINIRIH